MFDLDAADDGELPSKWHLQPVRPQDFEAMLAIRVDAMRPSLERLGRFDPTRARERFAAGFAPEHMRHIELDGVRVGFITLRADDVASPPAQQSIFKLDHLYLKPGAQGAGVGTWAVKWAKGQAVAAQRDITLSALKQSDANRFYARHGFVLVGQSEFDLDYRWSHASAVGSTEGGGVMHEVAPQVTA